MSSSNPNLTYQTQGALKVGLKLNWNVSSTWGSNPITGAPVTFDKISYGPNNEPPPPWAQGQSGQYWPVLNGAAYSFGAQVPHTNYTQCFGVLQTLQVQDMSSAQVLAGKTYAITENLSSPYVQSPFIQLYTLIEGVDGGSVMTPGIGLWNLGSNPHAWTYLTPKDFNGEWQIGVNSPQSFSPVWISVEYAQPKNYGQGVEARLIFTVQADLISAGPWTQANSADEASTPADGVQHLHHRSDAYLVHEGPGVPVKW